MRKRHLRKMLTGVVDMKHNLPAIHLSGGRGVNTQEGGRVEGRGEGGKGQMYGMQKSITVSKMLQGVT